MLQLIGMNSHAQACFCAGVQNLPRVIDLKRPTIAKNVNPFCRRCALREHLTANEVYVVVNLRIWRNNMRAKKSSFRSN